MRPSPCICLLWRSWNKFVSDPTIKNEKSKQQYQKSVFYIETTDEPEQEIPFHDSPHGSPLSFDFQLDNWEGEFSELYRTPNALTANYQMCK